MTGSSSPDLDPRRWFDRMLPQTLAFATWLLYLDGVFALLRFLDGVEIQGAWRHRSAATAVLVLVVSAAYPAGGFLMANGRRIGWHIAIVASFSPFVLRASWKLLEASALSWEWVLNGGDWINFVFEAALVALLLHPLSRTHARTWFR